MNTKDIISSFSILNVIIDVYIYNKEGVVASGQELGAESTMPYSSPDLTRENLLVGANFASAGVGILNDTGDHFVST